MRNVLTEVNYTVFATSHATSAVNYKCMYTDVTETWTVADPEFSRRGRGANPWDWGDNLLFGKIFAENCMKMKEIGSGGRP